MECHIQPYPRADPYVSLLLLLSRQTLSLSLSHFFFLKFTFCTWEKVPQMHMGKKSHKCTRFVYLPCWIPGPPFIFSCESMCATPSLCILSLVPQLRLCYIKVSPWTPECLISVVFDSFGYRLKRGIVVPHGGSVLKCLREHWLLRCLQCEIPTNSG